MAIWANLNLQQDVITLRLSYLSRSEAFRQDVLARLKTEENPFDMENFDIGEVHVGIVDDEREAFASKLDSLLGSGAGADYLGQENELTAPGVKDTNDNREHIWSYWKNQAGSNTALWWPKKRHVDEIALGYGEVHFTGEYTLPEGSAPDIQLWEGSPSIVGFRNTPGNWWKLERRERPRD